MKAKKKIIKVVVNTYLTNEEIEKMPSILEFYDNEDERALGENCHHLFDCRNVQVLDVDVIETTEDEE